MQFIKNQSVIWNSEYGFFKIVTSSRVWETGGSNQMDHEELHDIHMMTDTASNILF